MQTRNPRFTFAPSIPFVDLYNWDKTSFGDATRISEITPLPEAFLVSLFFYSRFFRALLQLDFFPWTHEHSQALCIFHPLGRNANFKLFLFALLHFFASFHLSTYLLWKFLSDVVYPLILSRGKFSRMHVDFYHRTQPIEANKSLDCLPDSRDESTVFFRFFLFDRKWVKNSQNIYSGFLVLFCSYIFYGFLQIYFWVITSLMSFHEASFCTELMHC